MSLRVWIWLVSLSVLWGGSFFFAKVAVAELRPLTVVFGRVALAAFALNLSLWLTGQSLFRRETPWAAFMLMGLLNNLIAHSDDRDHSFRSIATTCSDRSRPVWRGCC